MLYGVPAFDPYLQVRRNISMGLLGHEPTPTVPPAANRLVAFLDIYCPGIETLILALAAFKEAPIDVCVAGATANMRRFLDQQSHITVWKDYPSMFGQVEISTAVVHHGVQDVAQRCMSFGRPQLVLPWTAEQGIYTSTAQWMGFFYTKAPTVSIEEMVGTLRALLRDSSLVVAAQHHARQLADANLPDALPEIITRIESAGPPSIER
jgi:UDP:flavonoid glycosyltransferase YjiC (YdhE family)